METINIDDLPPLIRNSKLVKEIKDDGKVVIPTKYKITKVKPRIVYDFIIENDEDFREVMNQLRYYMVDELPYDIYKYVFDNQPDIDDFEDFFYDELECLTGDYGDYGDYIMNRCIEIGSLGLLKFTRQKEYPLDKKLYDTAAKHGHLDILKYLHDNDVEWSSHVLLNSTENGHLDCLKYAYENGCSHPKFTNALYDYDGIRHQEEQLSNCACRNGHLDLLKYITTNICTGNIRKSRYACYNAVKYRNFECLKYAHENGFSHDLPYTYKNIVNIGLMNAINNDLSKCLKYLIDHIDDLGLSQTDINGLLSACIEHRNYDTLKYLYSKNIGEFSQQMIDWYIFS